MASVVLYWVEEFPFANLQNGYVDWKMLPELTLTEWW